MFKIAKNTIWNAVSYCTSDWNAWMLFWKKRFRSELFQNIFWKFWEVVSQWKQFLFSHFLFHRSLLVNDQWDQERCSLKCLPWHQDWAFSWHFRLFQAFCNACSHSSFLMVLGSQIAKLAHCIALIDWFIEHCCYGIVSLFLLRKWHFKNSFLSMSHCW